MEGFLFDRERLAPRKALVERKELGLRWSRFRWYRGRGMDVEFFT